MKRNNPISILEDSFRTFKKYLENEFSETQINFDANFIQSLKEETRNLNTFCEELNSNTEIINQLNSLTEINVAKNVQYKVQHFMLSDIIGIYNQNKNNSSVKAKFTLAYYYDVLINNHYSDEKAVETLNNIAVSEEFQNTINTIISQNRLTNSNKSFILTVLANRADELKKSSNFFDKFAFLSFNLKLESLHFNTISKNEKIIDPTNVTSISKEDSIEKVLAELNLLVGLKDVKEDIKELINLLEVQKKREKEGLKNIEIMLHTVFIGPPGTGKTTVARVLGRVFKHLGYLSQGQLYETDREGMIAGFVGQTATKVNKVVEESKGGVLFIDEAYGLTQNAFGNDYGAEAVNTLLKRMEDYRDDLAVVVAGYNEPMQIFINSNPGLRSRFNRYFFFDHFSPSELFQIFETFCTQSDFILTDEASEKIKDTFELLYDKKDESFGNARIARNIFEKCVQNQANRIISLKKISKKALKTISEEDIPEPLETVKQVFLDFDRK